MKLLLVSFLATSAVTLAHGQTQQWGQVYFANHVLSMPPDRLVRGSDGSAVVGTYHAAQLYYGTNDFNFIPVTNPPATFRPPGTGLPGTWLGGMRTLVGIPPGTQTYMLVRFWHTDAGATFEEASRNNGPYRWTTYFTYVPPPPGSSLQAHYIENFWGVSGGCGPPSAATPEILVQPTNQTVRVGDDVVISVVSTNYCGHLWQFNGTNITTTNLPGSRFLVLTNVQPSQAGDYRVIVGHPPFDWWGRFVTSQVARLTVEAPPQWGEVLFENIVLSPPSRPFFPDSSPVTGTNFVAQLYYTTNLITTGDDMIAVTNPPAPFRLSPPGYWRGGRRTLVGVTPGTPVILEVRVWDGAWPTYEEANASGTWYIRYSFYYTPPPPDSPPEAYYMGGLTSFGFLCPSTNFPAILQQPTNQIASVGETVILSVDSVGPCMVQWQFNGIDLPGGRMPAGRFEKLRINNVQLHHEGDYRLILPGGGPIAAVTSQIARLTVRLPPQLASARYDNGAFAFHVSEDTGRAVVIETAPDLNPTTPWTPVLTNIAPFLFTNSTPADRQRFYRTLIR